MVLRRIAAALLIVLSCLLGALALRPQSAPAQPPVVVTPAPILPPAATPPARAGDAASIIALTAAYTPDELAWMARCERVGDHQVPPAALDFIHLHRSGAERAVQVAFIRDHFGDHPALARAALDWIDQNPAAPLAAGAAVAAQGGGTASDAARAATPVAATLPDGVTRPRDPLPPEFGAGGGHRQISGFQVEQ
jgi:hypothetical protein